MIDTLATTSVPVLAYHDVGDAAGASDPWTVPVDVFARHLDALVDAGWAAAPIAELPERPGTAAAKVVYLTFDDGFTSFGDTVVPMLAERGLRATVFVPTAFIGRTSDWTGSAHPPAVMSWSQLRALPASGIEIGSHGHRHLPSDLLARSELQRELGDSRAILEDGLGRPIASLAYPFGYHGRRVRSAAAASGYRVACEVGCGLHPLRPQLRFSVRRLLIGPDLSGPQLLDILARGQRSPLHSGACRLARPAWRAVRRSRRRTDPTLDGRPQ